MSRIVALATVLLIAGCATKKDIRLLREDMQAMSARQDSVLRGLQRQNLQLLDSIRATMRVTTDTRGNTANSLSQFENSIRQLTPLLTDIQNQLVRLDRRMTALEEKPAVVMQQPPQQSSGGGSPDEYYRVGSEAMGSEHYGTARMAYQQLVLEFPNDPRAPHAQYQVGEAWAQEGDATQAYAAFDAVVERWPTSAAAAEALFRAGKVAEGKKDYARARTYYQRVEKDYASTASARQAQQARTRLPRG